MGTLQDRLRMDSQDGFELKNGDRAVSPDNSETDSIQSGGGVVDSRRGSGGGPQGLSERKGSTCKTLRPLPTFVKVDSQTSWEGLERLYIKKEDLKDEDIQHNEKLYDDTMASLFPEDSMKDRFFRDKDKENAIRTWILQYLEEKDEENSKAKKKSSNVQEVEELNFLLKSGIVLCKLIHKIYPQSGIEVDKLETGNLNTKKKNISQFLLAALAYGVNEKYLFSPDDLVVMAHFHKVTRALFALAEKTKMDPTFSGQSFHYEPSANSQSLKRKASGSQDKKVSTGTLNAIFENLMQDVERKTSVVSRGPPRNIYSYD